MSTEVEDRVREESRRFRAALPELLPRYDGRWVIFLGGEVRADFDDEEAAYVWAVRTLGLRAGFVLARVHEKAAEPLRLSDLGVAGAMIGEAELERQAGELAALTAERDRLRSAVRSLQEETDRHLLERDVARAELDRLREGYDAQYRGLGALQAERDRLAAELADARAHVQMSAEHIRMQAASHRAYEDRAAPALALVSRLLECDPDDKLCSIKVWVMRLSEERLRDFLDGCSDPDCPEDETMTCGTAKAMATELFELRAEVTRLSKLYAESAIDANRRANAADARARKAEADYANALGLLRAAGTVSAQHFHRAEAAEAEVARLRAIVHSDICRCAPTAGAAPAQEPHEDDCSCGECLPP